MFLGSIGKNIRRFISAHAHVFEDRRVCVGCSGNFTAEKIIRQEASPSSVHSNDVSLYSLTLADAIRGQTSPIDVVSESYDFVGPYFEDADLWLRPAALMILLRLLDYEKQKNIYQERMYNRFRRQFDDLVQRSRDKLEERSVEVDSYFSGDVSDYFANQYEAHPDSVFVTFPPFYKGGYEKLFERLDDIFDWPKPQYPVIDDERRLELTRWLRNQGRRYMFILDFPLTEEDPKMISNRARARTVYLYTNLVEESALFRRRRVMSDTRFEIVGAHFKFKPETEVSAYEVAPKEIQYYKECYLGKNIDFTVGNKAFVLTADDAVFGFLEFVDANYQNDWYLNSDFPVSPRPHKRVSKLVVLLAKCQEIRQALEHSNFIKTNGVMTTAFTQHPVSMKYRGAMNLVKREDEYLNYYDEWSDLAIQEQYSEWYQKYVAK